MLTVEPSCFPEFSSLIKVVVMSITCPPHDYVAIGSNFAVCNKCYVLFDPAHPPQVLGKE